MLLPEQDVMMDILRLLIFGALAYLCGSIPFAKIIAHWHGVDIQKRGSGNIGFANTLRTLGWMAAIPVLLLDVAKGFLPTVLAYDLFGANVAFCVGFAAVVGHLAPVWLGFRGGKGVSTSLGVLLAITPVVGLVGFLVYVIASGVFKKSSVASLTAGFAVLVAGILIVPTFWWAYVILLSSAAYKLRKNFAGTVPSYDNA